MKEETGKQHIEECLKHIEEAAQILIDVPNEDWNFCVDSNFIWAEEIINAYKGIISARDRMKSYLNFLNDNNY